MTDTDRQPTLTGGCQCGKIRYAFYAAPERVHLCHCRMCQKAVGNLFAALAPIRETDFAWTRGRPATFKSSTLADRDYCRDCGTPLSFRYLDGGWIAITIGSLDEPEKAEPTSEYGIEGRIPWVHALSELPGKLTDDHLQASGRDAPVNFQHPDEDTPEGWAPPTA